MKGTKWYRSVVAFRKYSEIIHGNVEGDRSKMNEISRWERLPRRFGYTISYERNKMISKQWSLHDRSGVEIVPFISYGSNKTMSGFLWNCGESIVCNSEIKNWQFWASRLFECTILWKEQNAFEIAKSPRPHAGSAYIIQTFSTF